MKPGLKRVGKVLLGFLCVLVVACVAGLVYRTWRHHSAAPLYEITTPNGIDEAQYLDINGAQQWVTIRGHNRNDPIVLVVHGGPGSPMGVFARAFLPWERELVVVQWDQRGAGRTLRAAGGHVDPDLTIDQMTADGNRLTEHLLKRFGRDRIVVLGWSWGSALAVHMVKVRPELYAAYIGTGQFVSMQEAEAVAYKDVLEEAQRRGEDNAIAAMEAIGPPPYDSLEKLSVQRAWAMHYETGRSALKFILIPALWEPRTSLRDLMDTMSGMQASAELWLGPDLNGPLMQLDLRDLGPRFEVPMFIVQGSNDHHTPAALAREYFDSIEATDKAWFPIEAAGHFALVSENERFLAIIEELVARVGR